MTEVCAICRENLCQNTHTLECNHTYHTNCIMNWFRTPEATKYAKKMTPWTGPTKNNINILLTYQVTK